MSNLSDFYRGDTKRIMLEFTDTDGTAINLTNALVFFTMKTKPTDADADAVLAKTVSSHTDPTAGKTEIVLEHSDTDDLTPASYYYDIQLVLSNGFVATIDNGKVKVLTDITRRVS